MSAQTWRVILGVAAAGYLILYAFVLAVAFITTGSALVRSPGAWYAAVAPLAYAGVAGAHAFGLLPRQLPRWSIIGLHLATIPALAFSFLGLGLLLPVLALFWWLSAREPRSTAAQ